MMETIEIVITVIIAAGVVVSTLGVVLTLLGFAIYGIAPKSIASYIQALIRIVVAGSIFAGLTSLGMAGTLAVMAPVGAAVAVTGGVAYFFS